MAKLKRELVIAQGLDLLDEVGLDGISTRLLARRLNVEQPALYWHFRTKRELLSAMAEAAMAPHAEAPLPKPCDEWREWFSENTRSFRRTLLMRRDGARLHAGTRPGAGDIDRIRHKIAFLVARGLPERNAKIAMLAASHFTVGSVLEEQAHANRDPRRDEEIGVAEIDCESAFEAGLALIVNGLDMVLMKLR